MTTPILLAFDGLLLISIVSLAGLSVTRCRMRRSKPATRNGSDGMSALIVSATQGPP